MKIIINKNKSLSEIELIINTDKDDFYNWQKLIKEKYKLEDNLSKKIFINDIFQAAISKYQIDFYNVAHLEIKEKDNFVFEIKALLKTLDKIDIKNWQEKLDKKLIDKIKTADYSEKINIANQIIKNIVDQSKDIKIPNELMLQETVEFVQNLEQEILSHDDSKKASKNKEKYKNYWKNYLSYEIKTALVVKKLAKELDVYKNPEQLVKEENNVLSQQWLNKQQIIKETQEKIIEILS